MRYVDPGRYLCEVRIGQYWRLERLKSFDEFLERRFPESRRKAYYIMTIHEHLTRIPKRELRQIGWTKARELVRVARADGQRFDCAPWVHKASAMPREEFIDRSHVEGGSIGVGAAANSNLTIRQSPVLGSAAAGVQAEGATSVATIDNCECCSTAPRFHRVPTGSRSWVDPRSPSTVRPLAEAAATRPTVPAASIPMAAIERLLRYRSSKSWLAQC